MDYTLDIFNDNYFENDYDFDIAEEALGTGAKKTLAGILGGPLGGLIANVVHNSKVNKSIVVSYSQLIDTGLSEKKAAAECDKAVNFLISKGFLTDDYKGSKIVKFSDLTKDGKKFMKGYYSVMDKVTHFDYDQAINKSGKGLNKEAIGQSTAGVAHGAINAAIVDRSVKCLATLAQALEVNPLIAATTEFMGKSALSIAGMITGIPGIALSVVNIGASIKTAMNTSYFKKNMTAQECAFIAQFPDELLSDFGRMLKSDCMESAYDNAFESGYTNALLDMGIDPADVANESIDDVDHAFESGYAQAMNDMGYKYDTAMESDTKLKTAVAGILSPLVGAIYSSIHKSHIEQSNVLDVNDMIKHGMSKEQAHKEFAKTVNFFKAKGFLAKDAETNGMVVTYNMLTDRGQKYMQGFYDKMDDITPYTIQKAVAAKQNTSSSAYDLYKPLFVWHVIAGICTAPLGIICTLIEYDQNKTYEENQKLFKNTKLDD